VLRNSPSIEASPYRVVFSLPDTYPLPRSSTYVGADDPITIPVLLDRTDAFGVQRTGSGPSGGVVNMTGTIEIHGSSVPHAWETYRCSHGECGFTHEDNRDGEEFECLKCGKELHADYNAAQNIGWQLVQHWLKSGAGRATSQLALKSGTLNANGNYTPSTLRG